MSDFEPLDRLECRQDNDECVLDLNSDLKYTVNNQHDTMVSPEHLTIEADHHLSIILRTSEDLLGSTTGPTHPGHDSTPTSDVANPPMLPTTTTTAAAAVTNSSASYTSITTPRLLTQTNLKHHTANPPLPLAPGDIDSKLQAIRDAASGIGLVLPTKTQLEILGDMKKHGRGVMERWMGEQEGIFVGEAVHPDVSD